MFVTADSIKAQIQGSVVHKFFEAVLLNVEEVSATDKINLRSESKIDAKSPLGLVFNVDHVYMGGINAVQLSADSYFKGKIMAGPMYGETTSSQSLTIFPFSREAKIDSTFDLDSTIMQAKNTFTAALANGEMSVMSTTKAFKDILTHVAELSFKDNKLSLKHDANAFALGMKIHNNAEASAGAGEISMRMETSAEHLESRAYHLITAGLNSNSLTVNSDGIIKVSQNEATHKATLMMNEASLLIKGTNKMLSPLALENTIEAGFDASGATLSITNMAEFDHKKFDNVNSLIITLSGLDFSTKAEVLASKIPIYTHDVMVNMKPYTASATFANKLNIWTTTFINEARLQVEPYKMDLAGHMKAVYGLEEIKHLYQVNYADTTATFKGTTTGKIFGTHMTHNNELEVIGLAAKVTSDFRFHSQVMRYDHTIHCSVVPFDFNLDATVNADGDVMMYGKHSGQLYGKFLMKAQPLAFASTHECRASLTQQLDNGFALETTFDNKIDNAFSLQEQKTNFRMKSKVNDHAFMQLFTVYNMAERAGIEASSNIFTNVFNTESTENQEFSISGFVKYDKNANSHVIQLPLMENLPVFLESIKGIIVSIAEVLQDCINNTEIIAKLEALPDHLTDFISQINIGGYLTQLNQIFDKFLQKYTISKDDMEALLRNLQGTVEKMFTDIKVFVYNFSAKIKHLVVSGALSDPIILKTGEILSALNEKYDIQAKIVFTLDTMAEMIQEFDMEQFRGTRIQFLYDVELNSDMKRTLRIILKDLKELVEDFNMKEFAGIVRQIGRFAFIVFEEMFNEMIGSFPFEMFTYIRDCFAEFVQEFNIPGKISSGYTQIREVIVKFEADKKVQVILQSTVELIRQLKIEETMRTVSKMLKDANIPTKFMEAFQRIINYLKLTEMKYMIQELNRNIEAIVVKVKSLQYNDFVNYANNYIAKYTTYVNNLIRTLKIPQKLEATRDFLNQVLFSLRGIMERLREIKVAEIMKSLKDVMDELLFDNLRSFANIVKQKIVAFDAKTTIPPFMKSLSKYYRKCVEVATDMIKIAFEFVMIPRQKLSREIHQIISGIGNEVMKGELNMPSFVVPFTDLVVPPWKIRLGELGQIEIPTELNIPTFTVLDQYRFDATTVSTDDIKNKIIQFIDFLMNFEIGMPELDAFFGDLTMNFFPLMPAVSFPEITLPEFSFPTIPQVPVEKLVKSLQVPKMKFPTIPHEISIPSFGKLYGEFRFHTPIYSVKTSAEFQNSTENEMTPSFTGFLTSQAVSPFDILNYNLDTSARLAIPKMSRIVLAETFKLQNEALGVEHQASMSLYGLSAQAQAKTSIKVNTSPYIGIFMNTAFIAMEEGMSGSLETTYSHLLNMPTYDVRNEVLLTQKAIVRQNGYTITLKVDNSGKGQHNTHTGNHKSILQMSLTPTVVTVSFTGETDSTLLKMKQQVSAELGTLRYFVFNIRNEGEAPILKKSLLVASGQGSFYDMKIDIKADHHTELFGTVNGFLSNTLNVVMQPFQVVVEFQNKGNAKFNVFEDLPVTVDMQNDYTAVFKPDGQQVNTLALLSLNQHKAFYNFTVDNNENQARLFMVMESMADLDLLRTPISIPNINLPLVGFRTPAISNLNLYEQTGLTNIFRTTDQFVNMDTKVIYQKSRDAPLVDMMGVIQIPTVGDLITELSFKSDIINLNVNAGMFTEDDLVIRLRGITTSDYDFLNAKLDGTTSLTVKRGFKLVNSVSLENNYIEGTHESTIGMSTETLDMAASLTTASKIALPILNVEATQTFVADTRTKANTLSTFTIKGDFNIPIMKAVGKANAFYSLKLEGALDSISMESATRTSMNATVLEHYVLFGVLDNMLDLSLSNMGLRSTSKTTADSKLYRANTKMISMDVNENLAFKVSLSNVYAMLEFISNNEANLFNMNTKGKHLAKAKFDFTPVSSLTTDIEIDVAQQSSMGDFAFLVKNVADVTSRRQKMSTNMRFACPVYNTNLEVVAEGNAPVFKATMKSSSTSAVAFLNYLMDGEHVHINTVILPRLQSCT